MRKELLVLCPAKISRAQSRRRWPRGDRKRRSFWILSDGQICNGVSNLTGRCKSEPGSQEESALGEADCRTAGRAEPLTTWRRPRSEPHAWNNRLRSPQGVEEGSMLARNESQNAKPLGSRLGVVCGSEGVWYKARSGE